MLKLIKQPNRTKIQYFTSRGLKKTQITYSLESTFDLSEGYVRAGLSYSIPLVHYLNMQHLSFSLAQILVTFI
ncbi:hypothetical protein BpHYR1_052264 [Brachionus plicatilis]|uniref:Uncharacterized protein n=1 Tax=Brachionus plicatilis TaxID=10195 RepID=A0A3M7TAH9_BRAPC|nr:hypothetical protein BpHYR1_052264 [Brachionus plicatilis]